MTVWSPEFRIPAVDGSMELVANWLVDETTGTTVGLTFRHPAQELIDGAWPECAGGGYVAWRAHDQFAISGHVLVAGRPGEERNLTLTPSLWHRGRPGQRHSPHLGCHGFVEQGQWRIV